MSHIPFTSKKWEKLTKKKKGRQPLHFPLLFVVFGAFFCVLRAIFAFCLIFKKLTE